MQLAAFGTSARFGCPLCRQALEHELSGVEHARSPAMSLLAGDR